MTIQHYSTPQDVSTYRYGSETVDSIFERKRNERMFSSRSPHKHPFFTFVLELTYQTIKFMKVSYRQNECCASSSPGLNLADIR